MKLEDIEKITDIEKLKRKENQFWEMAGLARADGDTKDCMRNTDLAQACRERAIALSRAIDKMTITISFVDGLDENVEITCPEMSCNFPCKQSEVGEKIQQMFGDYHGMLEATSGTS